MNKVTLILEEDFSQNDEMTIKKTKRTIIKQGEETCDELLGKALKEILKKKSCNVQIN